MPLIYITGTPGSGKSTIQAELQKRGYEAHDIDDDGIGAAFNIQTGEVAQVPSVGQRTPEWFATHEWKAVPEAVKALKEKSLEKTIFLCGTASNEANLWSFFDKVFYLNIDEQTLRSRLISRKDNDFGKNDHEVQLILQRYIGDTWKREKAGVTVIDASKSVDNVVSAIIRVITR